MTYQVIDTASMVAERKAWGKSGGLPMFPGVRVALVAGERLGAP